MNKLNWLNSSHHCNKATTSRLHAFCHEKINKIATNTTNETVKLSWTTLCNIYIVYYSMHNNYSIGRFLERAGLHGERLVNMSMPTDAITTYSCMRRSTYFPGWLPRLPSRWCNIVPNQSSCIQSWNKSATKDQCSTASSSRRANIAPLNMIAGPLDTQENNRTT